MKRPPFDLRFDAPLEDRFRAAFVKKAMTSVRVGVVVGTLLYLWVAIVDVSSAQENSKTAVLVFNFLRYGLTILMGLGVVVFSFARSFVRWNQIALATTLFAFFASGQAYRWTHPGSTWTSSGQPTQFVALVILYGFTFSGLYFSPALLLGAVVAVLHVIELLYVSPVTGELFNYYLATTIAALFFGAGAGYFRERYQRDDFLKGILLEAEQDRSEALLLNMLPLPILERLKTAKGPIVDRSPDVSVLFVDVVGFTTLSEKLEPEQLITLLSSIFTTFDALVQKHRLEKIKTIGDAYMVAGGLPTPRRDHAEACAQLALDMRDAVKDFEHGLRVRIGLSSGPVVAGIIGTTKFVYDLWGDTVNTASRMESHGIPGAIQVTDATYQLLKDTYAFEERGVIDVKGKGPMRTFLLIGKRREAEAPAG